MRRPRSKLTKAAVAAGLFPYLVVVVFPLVWLFYTSLKPDAEIFANPFAPPDLSALRWDNFTRAWDGAGFSRYVFNSVLVTVSTVAGTLLLGSLAAYALARFRIAGGKPIFYVFLAGMMLPLQLSIVPLFFQMRACGLLNSRLGLILAYVATGLPFAIFVLTAFFRTLPHALYEAAQIDGCNDWTIFWRIMFPLAKPGLVTVAIFATLGTWEEYFLGFMFLSGPAGEPARTLPLGLAQIAISSQYRSDWGVVFAALVLVTVPVLVFYLFTQRQLIKGITSGAVKG